jgi:pimeloyl-ACP methyl ester carboxylesterase
VGWRKIWYSASDSLQLPWISTLPTQPDANIRSILLEERSHLMKTNFLNVARTALLALSAVAAAVALTACGASTAATLPIAPVVAEKPTTVVLVHGLWADGSSWSKVIPLLQQRGLKVVAVQLPRTSLADDAATVSRAIQAQPGQVVLVGHSYGGVVITEAGANSKVAALVYVSAFAPAEGESIADITSPYPAAEWQKGLVPDSGGFLSLNSDAYLTYFAPDLPKAEAAIMAATQGPVFNHVLQDRVSTAAWKTKPSWWAVSGNDQIVPAALQQGQASRIKAKATLIPGASHVALVSQPAAVSAVILDAVTSVGGL